MTTQDIINTLESEILESKAYLDRYDYKTTKLAEKGEQLDDLLLQQREDARARINTNKSLLQGLYAQLSTEFNLFINNQ